jgi:hypothetical protein
LVPACGKSPCAFDSKKAKIGSGFLQGGSLSFITGPYAPLLGAGVGELANDLPASILLVLEDAHTWLERADRNA